MHVSRCWAELGSPIRCISFTKAKVRSISPGDFDSLSRNRNYINSFDKLLWPLWFTPHGKLDLTYQPGPCGWTQKSNSEVKNKAGQAMDQGLAVVSLTTFMLSRNVVRTNPLKENLLLTSLTWLWSYKYDDGEVLTSLSTHPNPILRRCASWMESLCLEYPREQLCVWWRMKGFLFSCFVCLLFPLKNASGHISSRWEQ